MSNTQISAAEKNALSVSYDVLGSHVELDLSFVKRYLVRGSADKVSDQEVVFFMNTCKVQGLNPLVNGEVYLIKFGSDPAQMVVGKDAYLRRAFSNPDYLYKQDGITVLRGGEVIQKEGTCLYPGEELIGGWCRVHFMRAGTERTAFKEVSLAEYNKGQANWKSKPATMVNKVSISQCVRDAFPKDYEGIYSEDEMIASGAIPTTGGSETFTVIDDTGEVIEDPVITQEQRKELFRVARQSLGQDADDILHKILDDMGLDSTASMTLSRYNKAIDRIMAIAEDMAEQGSESEDEEDEDYYEDDDDETVEEDEEAES